MNIPKVVSLCILVAGYILAGINHFRNPGGYLKIMPPYLPYPAVLNILAGGAEIVLGILMIFSQSRPLAAWGIVLMLIAFIPVHVYMIMQAPMYMGKILVTPLLAWIRLGLQAVLIWWALWYTKS